MSRSAATILEMTLTQLALDSGSRTRHAELDDFDSVVRNYQKRIYRIVLLHVRDSDAADTLTQECFLRAFRRRDSFRGKASLETWLVRIAINLAYDHARSRRLAFWRRMVRGREGSGPEPGDPNHSPEQLMLEREEAAAVWASADRLPAQQRTAFLLRFAEEMSLEEIAGAMNLEVGTIKSHLSRALEAVKQSLRRNHRGRS